MLDLDSEFIKDKTLNGKRFRDSHLINWVRDSVVFNCANSMSIMEACKSIGKKTGFYSCSQEESLDSIYYCSCYIPCGLFYENYVLVVFPKDLRNNNPKIYTDKKIKDKKITKVLEKLTERIRCKSNVLRGMQF